MIKVGIHLLELILFTISWIKEVPKIAILESHLEISSEDTIYQCSLLQR